MKKILSRSQAQAVDRYTIDDLGIPSPVLMERAALSVAEEIIRIGAKGKKILAVCGKGNNGGDGIAVARILYNKGYDADIYVSSNKWDMSGEAERQLDIAVKMGMDIVKDADTRSYDIIIDAILGTGASRTVDADTSMLIESVNNSGKTIVSVDIPSGISATTGRILGCAVKADHTVTFGFQKLGTVLYPGCEYAGHVTVADIGYRDETDFLEQKPVLNAERKDLMFLKGHRSKSGNKGTFGKLLVIAGSSTICGAAYLAAKGALRTGAGLVKILTHHSNKTSLQQLIPEALISTYSDEGFPDILHKELRWADCAVMGPGMGTATVSESIVAHVLKNFKKPLLIDADGLNILAGMQPLLFDYSSDIIITPHIKEMSRLVGTDVEAVLDAPMDCASSYAEKYNVICVLKDARTYIADPNGRLWINTCGNNGMATGGSGDVLSGVIGGLFAQGLSTVKASVYGTLIHGLAGDMAAMEKGCYGLTASDIIDNVPNVLRWEA